MQVTQITTSAGHTAQLAIEFSRNYDGGDSTYVSVSAGGLSVCDRSAVKNDISLVESTVKTLDDMLTNLSEIKPIVVDEEDCKCVYIMN